MAAMNGIKVVLEGDNCWPELREKMARGEVIHLGQGTVIGLAVLPAGMQSGKPSIMFRLDLPDGKTVMAETSWQLLRFACDTISARFGAGGE